MRLDRLSRSSSLHTCCCCFKKPWGLFLWFLLLSLFVFPLENKLHLSLPCTKCCACWQVEQKVSGLSSLPSLLLTFSLLQSFIYLKQILLIPIISWYLNIIFQGQKMPITFSSTWSNTHIYFIRYRKFNVEEKSIWTEREGKACICREVSEMSHVQLSQTHALSAVIAGRRCHWPGVMLLW